METKPTLKDWIIAVRPWSFPVSSLPAFIAAFTQRKGISQQEAAEIRRMIDAAAGKE